MKLFLMISILSFQAYAFAGPLEDFRVACDHLKQGWNSSRFEKYEDAGKIISYRCSVQTSEISWSYNSYDATKYDNFPYDEIDKLHAICPGRLTVGAAMLDPSIIGTAGTIKSHLIIWCYL